MAPINHHSCTTPASSSSPAIRVTRGPQKTSPTRHPISTLLRNLQKQSILSGYKIIHTDTTSTCHPAPRRIAPIPACAQMWAESRNRQNPAREL